MATGQPFLATWNRTDNTLRLFELASEKFVQVGTVGVTQGADMTMDAYMAFSQSGNHIYTWTKASMAASTALARVFDLALAEVSTSNSPTGMGGYSSFLVARGGLFDYFSAVFGTTRSYLTLNADGTLTGPSTGGAATTQRFETTSPDEKNYFIGRNASGTSQVYPIASNDSNGIPTFGSGRTVAEMVDVPNVSVWATDSRFVMFGMQEGSIELYQANGTTAGFVKATRVEPLGLGVAVAIARRYDNRFWAVSFLSGGTYTTVIYKRFGTILKLMETVPGMGKCLDWTADGKYLLDAGLKKAFRYDGDDIFTPYDALLENVPGNVAVQAISPHRASTSTLASIYSVGVVALAGKSYDTANTKVALLDDSVVFDHAATSAAAILTAGEVSGNNWLAGGELLTGLTYSGPAAGVAVLAAAKISKTIAGGQIAFRNLLVYDATNDMPIIFVASPQDTTIDDGVVLGIDFSTPGMVQFST